MLQKIWSLPQDSRNLRVSWSSVHPQTVPQSVFVGGIVVKNTWCVLEIHVTQWNKLHHLFTSQTNKYKQSLSEADTLFKNDREGLYSTVIIEADHPANFYYSSTLVILWKYIHATKGKEDCSKYQSSIKGQLSCWASCKKNKKNLRELFSKFQETERKLNSVKKKVIVNHINRYSDRELWWNIIQSFSCEN